MTRKFAIELKETLLLTRKKASDLQLTVWLIVGALTPREKDDPHDPLDYPYCGQEWIGRQIGFSRQWVNHKMKEQRMDNLISEMRYNHKVYRQPIGIFTGNFPDDLTEYTVQPLLEWIQSGFLQELTKNHIVGAYLWFLAFRDRETGEIAWSEFFDLHPELKGPADCYRIVDFLAWALNCHKRTAQTKINKLQEVGLLRKEWRNRGIQNLAWWFLDLPQSDNQSDVNTTLDNTLPQSDNQSGESLTLP